MDDLTGERLGKYRLLEVIGQGGMSTVYKAVDEVEDSEVAVKLLSSYVAQEPRFKTRFNREIEVLKSLTGGKIVPILDHGEQEAFTYIVMPYLSQGTLQDRLSNGGLTLRESGEIVRDVSAALQQAHDRGVIHRDVKPSNILLDESGSAYLSDFGFAYVSESSHSLTGSVLIGTPAFMSPEQCRGESVDQRSDQYSLGAVLFQLATGRLPYEADTPMGMVVKHIHDPLPRPRSLNPYLPDAVETVIQRAMAKQPDERFESMKAFNRAYQRALRRSLDPDTGLPKPESVGPAPITAAMPASPVQPSVTPLWARRRTRWAAGLLALLAIPLTAWALNGRTPGAGSGLDLPTSTLSANLLATIQALSTENAHILGAAVGPEQIQTAVAATVQAMNAAETGTPLSPTAGPTASATPTRTPTFIPAQTSSSDSEGGSGAGGDSGPGPTAVPPTAAPTSAPTDPPPPTAAPPPPADTPVPPLQPTKEKCKGLNHPQFPCTETP